MTKRKIVTLALVAVIALTSIAGATMAYFTDLHGHQVENVFTIGNGIKIDLVEEVGIDNAVETSREGYDYENVQPTNKLVKVPTITNTGSNAAYVRVAVVMNNLMAINDAIDGVYEDKDYTDEQIQEVYDYIFDGWGINYGKRTAESRRMWMDSRVGEDSPVLCNIDTFGLLDDSSYDYYGMYDIENQFMSQVEKDRLDPDSGLYTPEGFIYGEDERSYYSAAVNKDERVYVFYLKLEVGESYDLFNGLNVPADFNNEQMEMFNDLHIDVYADAIQVAGFDSYVDAFTQLEAEHAIGWWNEAE